MVGTLAQKSESVYLCHAFEGNTDKAAHIERIATIEVVQE